MNNKNLENKFNIGVDLDDVVFEFVNTLIKNYEIKYNEKISYEDVFTYHFSKVFGFSDEKMNNIIEGLFDYETVRDMDLCDSAYDSIKKLSRKNDIYFITSRFNNIDATIESIENNFKDIYSDIVFSSNPYVKTSGKTKGELCRDYGIDFMIEDSKEHAKDCAEKDVKTFLLEKPWNKEENFENYNNIIKVKNWEEILRRIEE